MSACFTRYTPTCTYFALRLSPWPPSGDFVWTDRTATDYINWNAGEPNDWGAGEGGGGEDCVHVRQADGLWNDAECAGTHSFVCELCR